MSGSPLIAVPPSPASAPGEVVQGDGWWPDIDLNAVRDAYRVGETATDPRLIAAIEGGVLTVTGDLMHWQAELVTAGATSLAEVTAAQLLTLHMAGGRACWERFPEPPWPEAFIHHRQRYSPSLAAMLAAQVNGTARLVVLYNRAVRANAIAEMLDLAKDMGATTRGDIRDEARLDPAASYRRMALEAVRDILGTPRVSAELI